MSHEPGHPGYPSAPRYIQGDDIPAIKRTWAQASHVWQGLLDGKMNNIAEVTLNPNTLSTTWIDARLSVNSWIGWDPVTANAFTALGTSIILEADRNNGTYIITHANTAQADRTFRMLIVG